MSKITRQWEVYAIGPADRSPERLHVTLNQEGRLLLNGTAFKLLGSPEAVMLLYDRRTRAIGIRPARPTDKRPFQVRKHPNGSHRLINVTGFARHYNILPTDLLRFTAPEYDDNQILILDLNQTQAIPRKPRPPRLK